MKSFPFQHLIKRTILELTIPLDLNYVCMVASQSVSRFYPQQLAFRDTVHLKWRFHLAVSLSTSVGGVIFLNVLPEKKYLQINKTKP